VDFDLHRMQSRGWGTPLILGESARVMPNAIEIDRAFDCGDDVCRGLVMDLFAGVTYKTSMWTSTRTMHSRILEVKKDGCYDGTFARQAVRVANYLRLRRSTLRPYRQIPDRMPRLSLDRTTRVWVGRVHRAADSRPAHMLRKPP
jgi:hypothetical protein